MSNLNKLIKKLCPDSVEYIAVGSVVNFEQPTNYIVNSTDYNDEFPIPVLTAGQSFILGYTNEKSNIYAASKENPVIIFDDFTGAFKWVDFPFKVKSSAMKMLTTKSDKAILRYIYHIMGNISYTSDEHKRLWISIYSEIKIPVPPLQVQHEIIQILDNFTQLTVELKVELKGRKQQYEYYKDKLLNMEFENGFKVEWMELDQIAIFRRGSFPQPYGETKWYNGEGCMPFVQVADVAESGMRLNDTTKQQISKLAMSKSVFVPRGTVLVSLQGSIGRLAITHYDCYVDRTLAIFEEYKLNVDKRYFAYQLERKFQFEKQFARGSTIKTITKEEFRKFLIPIPPLEEQVLIVNILDRFDTLVNDIKHGLPAEIAARQKQYEYYRDKLLAFKEVGNESI